MNTGAFAILTAIAAALLSYRLYSSDPIMALQVEERMMKDDIMQSSMFVNAGVVKDVEKMQYVAISLSCWLDSCFGSPREDEISDRLYSV
jgi:hypothetical protein